MKYEQKTNMLTLIEVLTWDKKNRPYKCKYLCDCWIQCIKYYSNVCSWKTKDCWCVYKKGKENVLEKYWMLNVMKSYNIWNRKYIDCVCDCWNEKHKIYLPSVRGNLISSCGCIRWWWKKKHWHTSNWKRSRLYTIRIWIQDRCVNINSKAYPKYWWAGILCDRKSFIDFYNDMWESYQYHVNKFWEKETTIDRIDGTKSYNVKNCRRATLKEQGSNKSNNIFKWMSLRELCKKNWKSYTTILKNIHVRLQNKERNKELYIKNLFNL